MANNISWLLFRVENNNQPVLIKESDTPNGFIEFVKNSDTSDSQFYITYSVIVDNIRQISQMKIVIENFTISVL